MASLEPTSKGDTQLYVLFSYSSPVFKDRYNYLNAGVHVFMSQPSKVMVEERGSGHEDSVP